MTQDGALQVCVGNLTDHEAYPYEDYLLEHTRKAGNKTGHALDFGCGPGRMMSRMAKYFDKIDGLDLDERNLKWASTYLRQRGLDSRDYRLFLADGLSCGPLPPDTKYEFIYSTIVLQHIAVYSIRRNIFAGMRDLLTESGTACLQVGFGWDGGADWFDDYFQAMSTNGGLDACIADETRLAAVIEDFKELGFSSVVVERKPSPHPGRPRDLYHPEWLFIHLNV